MASLEQREVWSSNFEEEVALMFAHMEDCADECEAVVAFDGQFRNTCSCDMSWCMAREQSYEVLRANLQCVKPRGIGVGIAKTDGTSYAVWNFNLHGSPESPDSMSRMCKKNAHQGIDISILERSIADFARHTRQKPNVHWVTFCGMYDFLYLFTLLSGTSLPEELVEFDLAVEVVCENHHELRTWLPDGTLRSLAREYGFLDMHSPKEDAGHEAMHILRLFLEVACCESPERPAKYDEFDTDDF
eukprot:TRINITY_DN23076_c0_g1_i1.p1 TRINITY_DN23076_c0_g1~~TRINITY_DN23076_c0_g1_i1.p1  ORF type:complete len:245 (+),score=43.20 TRINITY_DN23076_c0_g1_i1:134-868(+)